MGGGREGGIVKFIEVDQEWGYKLEQTVAEQVTGYQLLLLEVLSGCGRGEGV